MTRIWIIGKKPRHSYEFLKECNTLEEANACIIDIMYTNCINNLGYSKFKITYKEI